MLQYKITNEFKNKKIYFKTIGEGSYAGSEILAKTLVVPFPQQFKNTGYSNLIQKLIEENKDEAINPTEDIEKIRFNSASSGTQNKVDLFMEFFFYNEENGEYGSNYESAGFTTEEVGEKRNNIKNSFYRLDFYDSSNQRTQNFLFSEFFNVNQNTQSTKFKLDRLFWFKEDENFIKEDPTYRELFIEITFFNAKNGLTTKFLNTTLNGPINLDTYNQNPNWRFGKIKLLNPYFNENGIASENRLFYVDTSINGNSDDYMSFYQTKIV